MIFAIPIEIKVREFLNKIYLASQVLKNTDFNILIGKKIKIYDFFKKNKNVVLLSKGGVRKNFKFSDAHLKNNKIIILDEEGPILNIGHYDLKLRTSNFLLSRCENFILWGQEDLKANKNFKVNKKKFPILGHPKFDLLKKPQSNIFNNQCNLIKRRFDKFILISSNFNGGDSAIDTNLYYKYYQNTLPKHQREKNLKFTDKVLRADKINYENMISLVISLAKKYPKINFVFRPHPRQNVSLVKKRFPKKIKNIKVEYKYTITPWIMCCDYFLHSGCSTVFEASILKKKIIYLLQENIPSRPKIFSNLGYFSKNVNGADNIISNFLNKKKRYNLNRSKLNTRVIENSYDKNFSKLFCKILNKIKFKNKIDFNYENIRSGKDNFKSSKTKQRIKEFILKYNLGVKILNTIDPNLLLTKSYKDKKFKKISAQEVKSLIERFSIFEKNNINYVIKKVEKDLYFIKNNKN